MEKHPDFVDKNGSGCYNITYLQWWFRFLAMRLQQVFVMYHR